MDHLDLAACTFQHLAALVQKNVLQQINAISSESV